MDRADHPGAAVAGFRQGQRGARPDQLRPVHVVVDHLRAGVDEMGGEGAHRDGVVRLVDHEHRDAQAADRAQAAAVGEGDDADVVAAAIEPREQRVDVLLGAAVGAGGHHLDDPQRAAARQRCTVDLSRAGLVERVRPRSLHPHGQPAPRTTRRRWIGWSTAPHSYLYGSSPRRKSKRVRPAARAAWIDSATSRTPGDSSRAFGSVPAL